MGETLLGANEDAGFWSTILEYFFWTCSLKEPLYKKSLYFFLPGYFKVQDDIYIEDDRSISLHLQHGVDQMFLGAKVPGVAGHLGPKKGVGKLCKTPQNLGRHFRSPKASYYG